MTESPSDRVRVRRLAARGSYDRDVIRQILDAALIAHVAVGTEGGPIVLPMAFGRSDDTVYLHGSAANHLLRSGAGEEICVTVTHVDGLVLARSVFHHSMNYRSVVIRGAARRVDDPDEKLDALRRITDHVVTRWDDSRRPNDFELRQTVVLAVPLDEASAKIRTGDPVDDDEDLEGPWWAGVVPVEVRIGAPRPAADLAREVEVPPAIRQLSIPEPPQVGS